MLLGKIKISATQNFKSSIINYKAETIMDNRTNAGTIIRWIFGIVFFAVAVVNTFWGNDPGFGVFLLLLSLVYFPPANAILRIRFGFGIPGITKICFLQKS